MNELERLRTIAKGKLSYRQTTENYEPVPKKRKRVVTRVERPLTVAKHFVAADASSVEKVVCASQAYCIDVAIMIMLSKSEAKYGEL